ncbi:MAG: hypothetical protein ACLUNG_02060 [[Clostridium] leptum]
MLNALIQNGNQTAVLELPSDPFTLQYELAQIGIRSRLRDIPIKDDEESPIRVKLFADSDIGNSLAVLFKPSYSLEDANLCAHMVENARQELLEELEQHIVHGQYHSPQAVMADIKAMTEELIGVTVSYYCPLQIHMTEEEYGDWYEVDNGCGIANEEAIRELVKREQEKDLHNMADYFHGSAGAKAKLISADWDVENVNGVLYGVIRTGLREPFSPEEEQEWIDELTGQAADGFGEGLEQREIKTEDGDIYVSFWHSGEDYFMENETDFRQRMSDHLGFEEQRIGGM